MAQPGPGELGTHQLWSENIPRQLMGPDICKYGDTYYIYFTVATRPRSNYVVWAKSPYGPWSDPIDLHIATSILPTWSARTVAGGCS